MRAGGMVPMGWVDVDDVITGTDARNVMRNSMFTVTIPANTETSLLAFLFAQGESDSIDPPGRVPPIDVLPDPLQPPGPISEPAAVVLAGTGLLLGLQRLRR